MPTGYEILTFLTYVIGGLTAILILLYHLLSQIDKEERKTTKPKAKVKRK